MEGGATMSTLLESLGLVSTHVLDLVADVSTVIISNPLLLMSCGVFILGAGIGIFRRLLSSC